jgi:hypothetical protein
MTFEKHKIKKGETKICLKRKVTNSRGKPIGSEDVSDYSVSAETPILIFRCLQLNRRTMHATKKPPENWSCKTNQNTVIFSKQTSNRTNALSQDW